MLKANRPWRLYEDDDYGNDGGHDEAVSTSGLIMMQMYGHFFLKNNMPIYRIIPTLATTYLGDLKDKESYHIYVLLRSFALSEDHCALCEEGCVVAEDASCQNRNDIMHNIHISNYFFLL